MLSEVLGVLVAFVSIILLLSIVVTGLVQATQAMCRVRGRNLLTCVTRLLEATGRVEEADGPRKNRRAAAKVLNSGNVAVTDKVKLLKPENLIRREIIGPTVSWVRARELAAAIKKELPREQEKAAQAQATKGQPDPGADEPGNDVSQQPETPVAGDAQTEVAGGLPPLAEPDDPLVQDIKRAEPTWCKRFQFFMRLITIAWALIIAYGFQVSTPALFVSLSKDPARVEEILRQQDEITRIAREAIAEEQYDLVADEALEELARKFPNYEDDILQAGNAGATRTELVQELEDVLPDDEQEAAILREYTALIDRMIAKQRPPDGGASGKAQDKLAAFGITWWKEGKGFYVDRDSSEWNFSAIIGVLLTAILLTFGAPFWFEQLRTLAALRDPRAAAAAKRRELEIAEAERNKDEEVVLISRKSKPQS